jgi:hypothetical protein
MIDAEANKQDASTRSQSSDSLQEVLFKDPPINPPPVAVNMCAVARPRCAEHLSHALHQERGRCVRRRTRLLEPPPQAQIFIRNALILQQSFPAALPHAFRFRRAQLAAHDTTPIVFHQLPCFIQTDAPANRMRNLTCAQQSFASNALDLVSCCSPRS